MEGAELLENKSPGPTPIGSIEKKKFALWIMESLPRVDMGGSEEDGARLDEKVICFIQITGDPRLKRAKVGRDGKCLRPPSRRD